MKEILYYEEVKVLENLLKRSREYLSDGIGEHVCYVYILGFLGIGKYYLGVRIGKGCHPSEFGISYRSSSKAVKRLWGEYGRPELRLILRTFREPLEAIEHERECLVYLGVLGSENWLNENISGAISSDKAKEGAIKRNLLHGNPRKNSETQRRLGFLGSWKRYKILRPMRQKLLTYEGST